VTACKKFRLGIRYEVRSRFLLYTLTLDQLINKKEIINSQIIDCAEAPSRARQLVETGDVLVSTVRPNLNAVALIGGDFDGATASTGFCVLRPNLKQIDSAYLFNWVKSQNFINDMVKKATGASYPAVSDRIIFDSLIKLPPLAEQKRIAAILDKAAEIKAKREQAIAKLDELAQSTFIEMFESQIASDGVELKSICERVTDGTHQSPKWASEGIPFIFISNIVNDEIDFDTQKFISNETYAELTRNCTIEIGDVLYTTVGSYGNVAIVRDESKFCFQRHIAHIKPKRDKLIPEFLACMLKSTFVRQQVDRVAKGVAQKTVNLGDLGK